MRGPADSYKSGKKNHYRRRVWNLLESREPMVSTPKPERNIVLIDEWRGLEARYLIEQRGYRPDQLHIVNLKPAITARITLSLKEAGHVGHRVHSFGSERACESLAKEGVRIHAAHFDFCSNVTSPDIDHWLDAARVLTHIGPVAVAVNVLRGRETLRWSLSRDSFRRMGSAGQAEDHARVRFLMLHLSGVMGDQVAMCECHPWHLTWDHYASTNGQTMLYVVCSLASHGSSVQSEFYRQWLGDEIVRRQRREPWTAGSLALPMCAFFPASHGDRAVIDECWEAMAALAESSKEGTVIWNITREAAAARALGEEKCPADKRPQLERASHREGKHSDPARCVDRYADLVPPPARIEC